MMLEALTHSDGADLIYNVDFGHSFMNWLFDNGKITEEALIEFRRRTYRIS